MTTDNLGVSRLIEEPQSFDISAVRDVESLNARFENEFRSKMVVESALTRAHVSFQANKSRAIYRWFKYKEAFSAGLVEYLLAKYKISSGVILDPFAGSGTTLFAAGALGIPAEGIELLPIGQAIIATKQLIDWDLTPEDIKLLERWIIACPWKSATSQFPLNELRITKGAYPTDTSKAMGKFLATARQENGRVQKILLFSLLCVLEVISYTRKDGQYLRWDYRSGRRLGQKIFDKGQIPTFDKAIAEKLQEMVADLKAADLPDDLFAPIRTRPDVTLHYGSCLDVMPTLTSSKYRCLITSPPYCNRYDYTRTYALELALLGVNEGGLLKLRQEMLSCTVENRAKNLLEMNPYWRPAIEAADSQELLQSVLSYLESRKQLDLLNNNGIPRMVQGYFYEMACVIFECARLLGPGAPLLMVNDNVRYAGASISVDIILSDIAQKLGLEVENSLVLPNGKGNSSQQMGEHGRDPLRKCVYVWRKV